MDNAPFELEPDAQELRRLAGERYEDMYRALLKERVLKEYARVALDRRPSQRASKRAFWESAGR